MDWFILLTINAIFLLLVFVTVMVWAIGEKVSTLEKKIDKKLR